MGKKPKKQTIHSSVALDRIVLYLGFYDGQVGKAKDALERLGFYAIDTLWKQGVYIWRRKNDRKRLQQERREKLTIVVKVKGMNGKARKVKVEAWQRKVVV